MADDAVWYHSFVPGARSRPQAQPPPQKLNSLDQTFTAKADVSSAEPLAFDAAVLQDPPRATVPVRAKSCSDHRRGRRQKRQVESVSLEERLEQRLRYQREKDKQLDELSDRLAEASHARYRTYLEQLRLSRSHVDTLLTGTSSTLQLLATLTESFRIVDVQTSTFQSKCENLLAEQKRLTTMADKVGQNLQYYDLLDPITRRLNAPGAGHLVRGDDFFKMLQNLDLCLEYMQSHPAQKEAAAYESRYRLLLTRALTLIRVHFTNAVRDLSSEVVRKIAERQSETTTLGLLYAKFRASAPELKRLGLEIHKRALPPPGTPGAQGEYQSLMNELYQSYSAARGRLLVPLVRKKLAEIDAAPNTAKDLVSFARASLSYIRGLCMDEHELWHEWFVGEGGLYDFLEAMIEPLFDYLKPRTIRETHLPKLCELCSIIQVRYMGQPDEDDEVDEQRLDFFQLVKPALEDAQTRLVFLALAVLRDSIERYRPTQTDLDCARRPRTALAGSRGPVLSGRKVSTNSNAVIKSPIVVEEENPDGLDLNWRYDTGAAYQEWYPTLRKAIWLLSKIYRLVNSTVFDDLAHRIVHETTESIHRAAAQVTTKHSAIDSQLFLLKEMLILKQQVIAFDIEFVTPELTFDFSNLTNTFWELRERGGLFDPRNLLLLVGGGLMPRVVENMLDAKAELDGRLRTVITRFTNDAAGTMTSSLTLQTPQKKDFDGPKAVTAVRAAVDKQVPILRAKLNEYIADNHVSETLVGAVQDRVVQQYEDFFDRIAPNANGSLVSKKGKSREDDVWDPDTFSDWAAGVFGVERDMSEDEQRPALSRTNT